MVCTRITHSISEGLRLIRIALSGLIPTGTYLKPHICKYMAKTCDSAEGAFLGTVKLRLNSEGLRLIRIETCTDSNYPCGKRNLHLITVGTCIVISNL